MKTKRNNVKAEKDIKDILTKKIIELIEKSKKSVFIKINFEQLFLYWNAGCLIKSEILKNKRADYGEKIISKLSNLLLNKYGKGWSPRLLWNCVRVADTFSKLQIMNAVRSQLSWTHIRFLITIDDKIKRDFYFHMSAYEKWSTRELQNQMNSMLFERTALSKNSDKLIKQELKKFKKTNRISEDIVFKDPYILDFLGLNEVYSERNLEDAIITELQKFITEFGTDFAFLSRQKRISIDNEEYYIDLLFFHRGLNRLIAIDLKLGKFKAEYKGQMELYLSWLEKYEKKQNELEPVGLILCADKSSEHIELLKLEKSSIKVAQYYTQLPPKSLLKEKLLKAIAIAKQKENVKLLEKTNH
jgi:predicted nuclease of restriction endonuclease-like (RecB) superfamily